MAAGGLAGGLELARGESAAAGLSWEASGAAARWMTR